MSKKPVSSDRAPAAIGPYSQAIRTGQLLFTSGQIPLDPATGAIVPGDITAQTRRVLENLGAVLEAGGATFADVVRTTIYLTNLADFNAVNAVYAEVFASVPPARSTIGVAALPRGAKVEIDAIAVLTSEA